jgi:hypothetical protein
MVAEGGARAARKERGGRVGEGDAGRVADGVNAGVAGVSARTPNVSTRWVVSCPVLGRERTDPAEGRGVCALAPGLELITLHDPTNPFPSVSVALRWRARRRRRTHDERERLETARAGPTPRLDC